MFCLVVRFLEVFKKILYFNDTLSFYMILNNIVAKTIISYTVDKKLLLTSISLCNS